MMFSNLFRRDPVSRARNFVLSHLGTVVCSLCGEGSNQGLPSALVRVDGTDQRSGRLLVTHVDTPGAGVS